MPEPDKLRASGFSKLFPMNQFKEPLYSQSYIDTGNGQPVILLHGVFGNLTMWRQTINLLRSQYRVIVPRLPLYDVPIHRANVKSFVEVLHDFLTWHRLTNVILVGTDIGGQIALCYANAFPDMVKRIVLSGSTGLFDHVAAFDPKTQVNYNAIRNKVSDAFFRKDIVNARFVHRIYETVNTFSKGLHISALEKSSRENEIIHFLHKLPHHVLLVWGLQDKITPPEVALHFHDLLKHGTLKFIDECGHLPMIEQSELYANNILAFLDSN
jgi:2-hydroxy-6-oxonona-2,4-dienedioate hydrolase